MASDATNVKAATEYGTYISLQQLSGSPDAGNFLPTGSAGVIYLASGSTGAGAGDGVHNVPNNYALSDSGTKFHFTNPVSASHMSASAIVAGHFFGDAQYMTNLPGGGTITSYTNSTNNRVITSVSSTTVNGEANLTFDGSVLAVAGLVSSSGDVYALGSISGSNNLSIGGNVEATGSVLAAGYLIANNEAQLKAGATVSGSFHALGNSTLGNANTDIVSVTAQLTASYGILAGHAGVGNTLISGSGGFLDLQAAAGNLLLSGSIVVGDAIKADAQDGATLGADGFEFSDLYLADAAVCYFGDDGEVTLTHVADTGLLLSDASGVGTTKLMFGDAACFVQQQADGELGIDADSIINITAPTVDIDASTAVLITTPSLVIDSSTDDKPEVEIKSTNAGANPPTLLFNHDSGSPADDDELGEIAFNGDDDGGTSTMFAKIVATSADVTNGTEDGTLIIKNRVAGSVVSTATFWDGTYGLTLLNSSAHGVIKAHSLATYSDETLKTNIAPIDSALDKVQQLQGVTYDWKSDGTADIGFIAQEVKEIIPQVVYGGKEDGDLGLDYGSLTALLAEAIKEQQSQIEDLKNKLEDK